MGKNDPTLLMALVVVSLFIVVGVQYGTLSSIDSPAGQLAAKRSPSIQATGTSMVHFDTTGSYCVGCLENKVKAQALAAEDADAARQLEVICPEGTRWVTRVFEDVQATVWESQGIAWASAVSKYEYACK